MSTLVITYIAYEEKTIGYAAPIYGPQLWSGKVTFWHYVCQ